MHGSAPASTICKIRSVGSKLKTRHSRARSRTSSPQPPSANKTLLDLSALIASGEAMERFLSQISGRGCQGDRRGRRKHRTCAQGVGEVRCGLASNPRQPIASSPCHVDKSAIMTAERSRSRTGGGRPFKVLAELHEHRAPFLARWPETAAGFAIALPPSELIGVAETARAR